MDLSKQALRLKALDHAVYTFRNSNADIVIKAAEKYFKFLLDLNQEQIPDTDDKK